MRFHLNRDVVFLAVIGVVVATVFFGSNLLLPEIRSDSGSQSSSQSAMISPIGIIERENALLGTSNWIIPDGKSASTQIQAYASATSVQPGQTLKFYVSTQKEGTRYSLGIYRLGWYGGLGGRLMFLQNNQIGHTQGYYDRSKGRLIDCNLCHIDAKTNLVEANWQAFYTLKVPSDWVTGVYLAKLVDADGMGTYVPFDVRGNYHSTYIVVTSDTTAAAYNTWGGYSLYEEEAARNSIKNQETNYTNRAVKVSFDRPYTEGYGSGYALQFEFNAIRWLERQGYDLSYMSSVDLHKHPQQLLQHSVYLSIGHDEYWTKEMRDGVEYARDHGVSLGFFGANASYWQMRFEPDSAGNPDRTVVCYKVYTIGDPVDSPAHDPFFGKDNTRVTAQWRDPVLARPENSLIGIMYSSYTVLRDYPWQLNPQAKSPLLNGTGLQPGHQYGCDLVGYEWDRVVDNGATPKGLIVLGLTHIINVYKQPDISSTTYYIAPSGAMVFAAGSVAWTDSLDAYRFYGNGECNSQSLVVPELQKLMANVMTALAAHHP